jgi:hypothetical protein
MQRRLCEFTGKLTRMEDLENVEAIGVEDVEAEAVAVEDVGVEDVEVEAVAVEETKTQSRIPRILRVLNPRGRPKAMRTQKHRKGYFFRPSKYSYAAVETLEKEKADIRSRHIQVYLQN